MYDYISERCCANCEDSPAYDGSLFCSKDCRDEYEGTRAYAENEHSYPALSYAAERREAHAHVTRTPSLSERRAAREV